MDDYEHVRSVKNAVERRLLAIPGVHAVGLGPKYVKGQSTNLNGMPRPLKTLP
jgi:hypothetical protein